MMPLDEAGHLADEDQVVGLRIGNEVRAYPLKILNYHQVVNDRVGVYWFVWQAFYPHTLVAH